nr:oxygenase MpaB family protein [Arthrobacter sp. H35-D1]
MMEMHRGLAESVHRQTAADPGDWEATYRQMVLYDLAADVELGFFLAYYRNFAIPGIAATLHRNGEIIQRPVKRTFDTAIVTYELIACGLNSERGRHMIRLLNRVHRHVPGSNDDFLYVLLTLLDVPIRWARGHAWRAPTLAEEAAATRFYQELGARMNIAAIPATLTEAERFFDHYERVDIAHSPAGVQLMAGTVQVLKSRLPALARPVARTMLSAMFDDDRLTDALGLHRANRASKAALRMVLETRNAIHRRRPLVTRAHFVPGEEVSGPHPTGYRLADIGPENIMKPTSRPNHGPS